ncbi:MAG: tetratricopeptide repeat protein [Chloroflexota bacterium]|nr:tetratricopeptide repeat protein [Chloroflexota bacterium]
MKALPLLFALLCLAAVLGPGRLIAGVVLRNASTVVALHGGQGRFDAVLHLDPADRRARVWLARQRADAGDLLAAASLLQSPTTSDGWILAGRLAWQQGDRDAALSAWRHVPDVAYRLIREGEAAARQGDLEAAREALMLATVVRPASGWVTRRLGQFLLGPAGDPVAAALVFERAIEQGEGAEDAYVYVEYAHALQQSGRLADAVAVLAAHPIDAALANAIRAEGARARGDLAEAARLLERATRQGPNDPWFWFALGKVYADQGRTAEARAAWEEALRAAPAFRPARDALGLASP